jgi:2'-hydroxyisoflavone reductase
MTTRRDVLQLSAWAAAGALLPPVGAADTKPRTLLILGGTGFIGPPLTQEALQRGWKVTHFNRGKTAAEGVTNVETLIGDRKGQLDSLRGRKWDAMIDDTGYVPKFVRMSNELLAPSVGYCLYISSIAAYASFAKPNDEHSPTGSKLADPDAEQVTKETYGPMKALCEQYFAETFKGRLSIVRPGYIVGPGDPTDRFTYWPVRASRGGEMLAPGTAQDPIQVIDVRDLAAWMMQLVEKRTNGYFNAISAPRAFTMGELVRSSERASPQVTWVPEDFLAAHWKSEELGLLGSGLTPWLPGKGETAGGSLSATDAARKTGLRPRPLEETVRDTLAWFRTLPAERQARLRAGLDAQKEADTLHLWHDSARSG